MQFLLSSVLSHYTAMNTLCTQCRALVCLAANSLVWVAIGGSVPPLQTADSSEGESGEASNGDVIWIAMRLQVLTCDRMTFDRAEMLLVLPIALALVYASSSVGSSHTDWPNCQYILEHILLYLFALPCQCGTCRRGRVCLLTLTLTPGLVASLIWSYGSLLI